MIMAAANRPILLVNEIIADIESIASDSNISLEFSEDGTTLTLPKIN